jgi:uncharacterized protein YdaU (DUF1376 family)
MHVEYVSFELDKIVAAMSAMDCAERGAYISLLFYLYQNEGRCAYDLAKIKVICGAHRNFAKVWSKIEGKFRISDGVLRHKIVNKKLRKIRKEAQAKHRAGLIGATARWQTHSRRIATAMPPNNQTTKQPIQVNIGIANTNLGSLVDLEKEIQKYNLRLGDILKPGVRSAKTLARITCHVKEMCLQNPHKLSLLPDLIRLAHEAHEQGRKDNGIPLFVHKAKQLTGYQKDER